MHSFVVNYLKLHVPIVRKTYRFLICLSNTPLNFLLDYFNSIYRKGKGKKVLLPWMNYRVINFILRENLIAGKRLFEYGSGSSTQFWYELGASFIVSIEHDENFYNTCRKKLIGEFDYRFIPPILNDGTESTYTSEIHKGYDFSNYVKSINDFDDDYFDIIVIDGRARSSCLKESVKKLKSGGIIIFDNAERKRYLPTIAEVLNNWKSNMFKGSVRGLLWMEHTQIFYKP